MRLATEFLLLDRCAGAADFGRVNLSERVLHEEIGQRPREETGFPLQRFRLVLLLEVRERGSQKLPGAEMRVRQQGIFQYGTPGSLGREIMGVRKQKIMESGRGLPEQVSWGECVNSKF